jgi:hypothetical protein
LGFDGGVSFFWGVWLCPPPYSLLPAEGGEISNEE